MQHNFAYNKLGVFSQMQEGWRTNGVSKIKEGIKYHWKRGNIQQKYCEVSDCSTPFRQQQTSPIDRRNLGTYEHRADGKVMGLTQSSGLQRPSATAKALQSTSKTHHASSKVPLYNLWQTRPSRIFLIRIKCFTEYTLGIFLQNAMKQTVWKWAENLPSPKRKPDMHNKRKTTSDKKMTRQ